MGASHVADPEVTIKTLPSCVRRAFQSLIIDNLHQKNTEFSKQSPTVDNASWRAGHTPFKDLALKNPGGVAYSHGGRAPQSFPKP